MTSAPLAEELAAIIKETCGPWAKEAKQPYEIALYDREFDLSARIVEKFGKGIVDKPFRVFGRIAVRAFLFASVALKRARKPEDAGSATAVFAARLALGASKDLAEASGMMNDYLKLRAHFPFGALVARDPTNYYASAAAEEWLAAVKLGPSERTAVNVHLEDIVTQISPSNGLFTRARLNDFSEPAADVVSTELRRRDEGKCAFDEAVCNAMTTMTDEKEIYGAKEVLAEFVRNVKDVLYESTELAPAFQEVRKAIKRRPPAADESIWSWLKRTKDAEPELNRFYQLARDYDPDDIRPPARPRRDTPSPPIIMKAIVGDNEVVTPSPKKLRFA